MIDWIVLLSPLLVLGVLMLVGFAGCKFEHGVAPSAIEQLTLRARVPTALSVIEVAFKWTPPGGVEAEKTLANPSPSGTDGADGLYDHALPDPAGGPWTSTCTVTAKDETGIAPATAPGDFNLDGELTYPTASFQAAGTPSTGFTVTFVGVS